MIQAKFTIDEAQSRFLSQHKKYGFKDKSSVIRAALDRLQKEFEQEIKSTGFYRAKAKNILAAARMIKEKFGGKIPRTMKEILELPGVARKTANVVLGNAYGVVEGIAVDTHVRRLSRLFGLTKHNDPVKIEQDLMKLLPKKEWFNFTYRMIDYGRKYCTARCKHQQCPLRKFIA